MLEKITDELVAEVNRLRFSSPVDRVYNPLEYARKPWDEYCRRFGSGTRNVLLVGMNPGPFGMAQVGVPFGEISAVRDWMGITAQVDRPANEHPKRPVSGFACTRSEVSGRRLWNWAMTRWGTAENFFGTFFVTNYCPLVFMEKSGRNLTPDKLAAGEKTPLFSACDRALKKTIDYMKPLHVMGIGAFTADRLTSLLADSGISVSRIPHPSPANPAANRGWDRLMDQAVEEVGILPPGNGSLH